MRYRFDTTARDVIIALLKRVFKWNKRWMNVGIEELAQAESASPMTFEDYLREPEQYPVVFVQASGGQADKQDIRDMIGTAVLRIPTLRESDTVDYCQRVGDSGSYHVAQAWKVNVPVDFQYFQEVEVSLAWCGRGLNDSVSVALVSGSLTNAACASGSIAGFTTTSRTSKRVIFSEAVPNTVGTPYWVTVSTSSGSGYVIYECSEAISGSAIATQVDGGAWSEVQGATFDAAVYDKSYYRIGGGETSTVTVGVMAKDLPETETISDVIQIYLELLKQAVITRRQGQVGSSRPADGVTLDSIGDLAEKGVYITDIRPSAVTSKPRGNDIIFSRTITVSCYGAWWEDFEIDPLRGIDLSVNIQR